MTKIFLFKIIYDEITKQTKKKESTNDFFQ